MRLSAQTIRSFFLLCALGCSAAAQSRVWVDPSGDRSVRRTVVDAVNFETDTAVVVTGHATLMCVAEAAKGDPTLYVEVEGYADGRGGDAYNLRLSEARARSVVEYLLALGAPGDRVRGVGKGKAGPVSDKVTNFAQRKALVILHQASFDGELIKSLPTDNLPCSQLRDGELPVGRIESNGQTFLVSVDYSRIRQDFRAEIARMIADRQFGSNSEENRQDQEVPRARAVANPGAQVPQASEAPAHEYRFTLLGFYDDLKTEKGLASLEASGLFRVPGGGIQTGIQAEFGSYRRKLQGDVAYSAVVGWFQGTIFGSYTSLSGTASDNPAFAGSRAALVGGARIAGEWESLGLGVFFAQGTADQSASAQPAQQPLGVTGVDLRLIGEIWHLAISVVQNLSAQANVVTPAVSQKSGGIVEAGFHLPIGLTLLAKVEALPIYSPFSAKRETRFGFGFRIGGAKGGQLPTWTTIPSARLVFPF